MADTLTWDDGPRVEDAPGRTAQTPAPELASGTVVKRHRLSTRLWHWVNALTLLILLMSGLMIFNAHPRLYWGQYGANFDYAWLEIGARDGGGFLRVGSLEVPTTGVLGVWTDAGGAVQNRAFPHWMTIPSDYSLADARLWHLAFAMVLGFTLLAYMIWSLANRHITRDLSIRREEWRPAHIWADIKAHARLRFPKGSSALRYNVLQKFSYIGVIFVLLPLVIATGMTMSPNLNAAFQWMLDLFGGRQSARSLHFLAAGGLVAFFVIHIVMVVLAGPVNEIRSMITGRWRIEGEEQP